MRETLIVARKEFMDCLRSRWLISGSLLFAILSIAVFFGTAAIGGSLQFQPLATVVNSLLSLTVFLLPLLSLMLCYDAFVGEAESGTLLLMLTYPLSRTQWLLGKALGQGSALAVVLVLGFAALPVVQAFLEVPYPMGELLTALGKLAASGWLLALVFMLLAGFFLLDVFRDYVYTFMSIEAAALGGSVLACVFWGLHKKYKRQNQTIKTVVKSGVLGG